MNYLIQNVLIPKDKEYAEVDVWIVNGLIHSVTLANTHPVDSSALDALQVINGKDKLLLPGFVNAHTHSSQVWQRGLIPQLPLELWLANMFDTSPTELQQVYWGAVSTAVDTLLSGGTCITDHLLLIPGYEFETVAAAIRGYQKVGIRALITPLIQDQPFAAGLPGGIRALPHQPYPHSTQEILQMMEAIITQFHQPEAGIYIGVGPTGFHRCSDALLQGCAELSERYQVCCHTHLLETRTQKQLAQERYNGSAVLHLQQHGLLTPRTSLAHCVWLEDTDLPILAETGATVVHNPVSNLRLGSGIAPILKCLAAGVNVAFGCDGAASNDGQNLLEAIKLGTMLHNITDPDYRYWITPRTAVEMASLGGAKGVNLADQTGTIAVGKAADLVLYDLTQLSLLPRTDPIQLLVYGRPTQVIDSVWVRGKQIVGDQKLLLLDLEELTQAFLQRKQPHNVEKNGQTHTLHNVETYYRKVALI